MENEYEQLIEEYGAREVSMWFASVDSFADARSTVSLGEIEEALSLMNKF